MQDGKIWNRKIRGSHTRNNDWGVKGGLSRFKSCNYDNAKAQELHKDNVVLIYEYVSKLEEHNLNVGEVRCANRGLEALMWYRDEMAEYNFTGEVDVRGLVLKVELEMVSEDIYDAVNDLVKMANFEEIWLWINATTKASLLSKWGHTLYEAPDDILDDNSPFPYHSKRELRLFEKVMGREFDLMLRE